MKTASNSATTILHNSTAVSFRRATTVEQNIQNRKLLSLGLDCLRLCGAMEREQTAELTEPLAMTM